MGRSFSSSNQGIQAPSILWFCHFQLLTFRTTMLTCLMPGRGGWGLCMRSHDQAWKWHTSLPSWPYITVREAGLTLSFARRKSYLGGRISQIQGKLSSKYSCVLTDVWYSIKHLSIGSYPCCHINYRNRTLGHWWIFIPYCKLLIFNLWVITH